MAALVSKFKSSQDVCWLGSRKVLAGAGNCVSSFRRETQGALLLLSWALKGSTEKP